jgi:hypothetical protein
MDNTFLDGDNITLTIDDLLDFKKWDEDHRQRALRNNFPHALIIAKILMPYENKGLQCRYVEDRAERLNKELGFDLDNYESWTSFRATVRQTFQLYNPESSTWQNGKHKRNDLDAIFYWPRGKRNAIWAVRLDLLPGWLERRHLEFKDE